MIGGPGLFHDTASALLWVRMLAAIGILISTAELLANADDHRDDRLFSWKVFRSRPALVTHPAAAAAVDALLCFPRYLSILRLRAVAIVLVLFTSRWPALDLACLAVVLLTTLLVNFRSPFGQDGSDQMSSLIFVTLFLATLFRGRPEVQQAAVWFIALQSCLAYFAAGVAKARGALWTTRGDAVFQIFNTSSYGSRSVAAVLKERPALGRSLTWSVVGVEVAFPLVLVSGNSLCWLFLAWGLGFHLVNAVVMGLNSFVWAFLATYPAILFCTAQVSHALA